MFKWIKTASICTVITLLPAAALAERLSVVATFSILGDFAQQVGGDRINLSVLVGPGSDVHVYEPRPADAITVAGADVILTNGLSYEGFLARLVEASGTDARIAELTEGVALIESAGDPHDDHGHDHQDHDDHDHAHDDHAHDDHGHHENDEHDHGDDGHDSQHGGGHDGHNHGKYDPHAWQSVANAQIYVQNIAKVFCEVDPEGCATYQANAAAYQEELRALDAQIRDRVAALPEDRRSVVVPHNAFRHYEAAYGVTFLAPQGISTESEASAGQVAQLIQQIRAHGATAIFAESISDKRLIERIAADAQLTVAGTLYSDALSGPDGPAQTYISMMQYNTDALIRSLSEN